MKITSKIKALDYTTTTKDEKEKTIDIGIVFYSNEIDSDPDVEKTKNTFIFISIENKIYAIPKIEFDTIARVFLDEEYKEEFE